MDRKIVCSVAHVDSKSRTLGFAHKRGARYVKARMVRGARRAAKADAMREAEIELEDDNIANPILALYGLFYEAEDVEDDVWTDDSSWKDDDCGFKGCDVCGDERCDYGSEYDPPYQDYYYDDQYNDELDGRDFSDYFDEWE